MDILFRILNGMLGIIVMLGIAFAFSFNRKKINWRIVGLGTLMQFVFALLILKTGPGKAFFDFFNNAILKILSFSDEGARFVFGNLISDGNIGAFFGFKVLPTIIFFSSMISVLYYLGVMQKIVHVFAVIMMKILGTSGAETLSCSANIFVGQTEAPLLIKPFVETMTKSELLTIMTGGFATVAGGVMAAYVGMLSSSFPDIAGHLLSASIMNAPGAILMSKIILPEEEEPLTKGEVKVDLPITDANIVDAAANGAGQGLQLALNVGAMLMAFIALIAMINYGFELIGTGIGRLLGREVILNLELIFGWIFSPIAWVMGVPWKDCQTIGALLGKRLVINEFVSYLDLAAILSQGSKTLDPRSVVIATYALCGFANFSSIAIQIGGIGGIAPSRRPDLARLGIYGVIAGTLACFQSASIAGMLAGQTRLQLSDTVSNNETKEVQTIEGDARRTDFYQYAASQLNMECKDIISVNEILESSPEADNSFISREVSFNTDTSNLLSKKTLLKPINSFLNENYTLTTWNKSKFIPPALVLSHNLRRSIAL